jgi:hypothetical protein
VIVAAATPLDYPDFDEWYRKEHCYEISKCPGYRRTRRYKLTHARQNRLPEEEKQLAEPPKYLAMVSGNLLSFFSISCRVRCAGRARMHDMIW